MIKNADEARRIIHSYNNTVDPMLIETQNVFESKGYLTALSGPEVKALVEALDRIVDGDQDDGYHASTCFDYCDCYKQIADKALAQYRDATKVE